MSDRIKKKWRVLRSIETASGDYCVDFFARPDGSYGFEEFRRDPEDLGKWTAIHYYSELSQPSQADAIAEAKKRIAWLTQDT